jgi:predicted acetyltransferase
VPRLVSPALQWRDSYRSLVAEFRAGGEPFVPFCVAFPTDDFPALVRTLEDCSRGIGIPEGFVPHTTYWLIDDVGEVVGVSNLRHRLTEKLLREGGHIGYGVRPSARRRGHATFILAETLKCAKQHGISRALVTCDKTNIGSAKAILHNGGVLESEVSIPGNADLKQRYWIAIS